LFFRNSGSQRNRGPIQRFFDGYSWQGVVDCLPVSSWGDRTILPTNHPVTAQLIDLGEGGHPRVGMLACNLFCNGIQV
jgi:hypothetical protein